MWRTRGSATESARVNVRGLPKNRLETLVDGVFAIAMTILVLELRAPDTLGPGGLAQSLFDLRSRFATFVISFIVLGVYWFAHHQVFHFLLRVNRTLVWLKHSLPDGHRARPVRRIGHGRAHGRPDRPQPLWRGPRLVGGPGIPDLVVHDRRSRFDRIGPRREAGP